MITLLALLPGLALGAFLRNERLHHIEEALLSPTSWSLHPVLLPPRFLIISSPQERIISYAQVGDDYRAVKGLVKPLIKGGNSPKGIAFDARHNRLYVADPGLRRIRAWRLYLDRCFTLEEKAGLLGATVTDPFTTDAAEGPNACDLPWVIRAGGEVTVVSDVTTEWVSLDHNGHLYYSDAGRNSVNKIDASLLMNLLHGEVTSQALHHREMRSQALAQEGKEAMKVKHAEALERVVGFDGGDLASSLFQPEAQESEDIIELYQAADTHHVAAPAGVVSDTVQVYWANQGGASVATGFLTGSSSSELTSRNESAFGIAATTNAILFSSGASVYAVPKFGGGNATALNEGFIVSRGLAWDGSGTVFVADEGASTVYAMPCGVLAEQPVQPVLQLHGAWGLALVQATDPLVSERSCASQAGWLAVLAAAWFL